MSNYRYYLIARPISLGTQPNGFVDYGNFDSKRFCVETGCETWGWVEYEKPLSDEQIAEYELVPETVGNRFRRFRQEHGSRSELSEKTGISKRTIEAWEQGARDTHKMTVENLKAIATAYNLSMDEVYKNL